MHIRCYRCSWSFDVKRDEVAEAVKSLESSGGTHFDVHCPRCRSVNKVPIDQLRRSLPRGASADAKASETPGEEA